MTDRNWEKELAKIDKQLASISDDQLLAPKPNAPPAKGGTAVTRSPVMDARMATQNAAPKSAPPSSAATSGTGTWRGWLKVTLAVAAAAGLMYWPWPARCGPPLMAFTAATGGVALLGLWSAVGTWRHRLGLAHVASLLVLTWGMVLGAREVLPRIGYAMPTAVRTPGWSCDGVLNLPAPNTSPVITPSTTPGSAPSNVPSVTIPEPNPAPAASPAPPGTPPGRA